jgi:hypothetical protein
MSYDIVDDSADSWEGFASRQMFNEVGDGHEVVNVLECICAALVAISKRLKTIADNQLN